MRAMTDAPTSTFAPVRAETGEPCKLAMQELWLSGRVLPVGALLLVRHTFRCDEKQPHEIIYAFGLPRDAALRRFRVAGEGFAVRSELRPVEEAQEIYEQGIEEGHLSTLARQYRDGVVNLSLGNIRPGETVTVYLEIVAGVDLRDDGFRFRFPFTLAPAYHSSAKPVQVEPGMGEIELPMGDFDDMILPQWTEDARSLHRVGFRLLLQSQDAIAEVGSPSHALRVQHRSGSDTEVSLATVGDVPDRDLVLDVRYRRTGPVVLSGKADDGSGRFAVVAPSDAFGETQAQPRNIVIVLDRSGSMQGAPMEQALRATRACLGALSPEDHVGLVAFDTEVISSGPSLLAGTPSCRQQADQFLAQVDARGGTELLLGLTEAFSLLSEDGGDVFLLTDGQVGATEEIISAAKNAGVRIHCLGIGSASQDRFLSLLATKTGGVSRMVTPRERVDLAALELFVSVGRPVASDLSAEIHGMVDASLVPAPTSTVFGGHPLVLYGSARGSDAGQIALSWTSGGERHSKDIPLVITSSSLGDVLRLLQGAKQLSGVEAQYLGPDRAGPAEKRRQERLRRLLTQLSQEYGLASRTMALVAVVARPGDEVGNVPLTRVVPVGMPQDTLFGSYFGSDIVSIVMRELAGYGPNGAIRGAEPTLKMRMPRHLAHAEAEVEDPIPQILVELAGGLAPDGGLPGQDDEERIAASLLLLLLYVAEGHSPGRGAFSQHVERLLSFLKDSDMSRLDERRRGMTSHALTLLDGGRSLDGEWLVLARDYVRRESIQCRQFWAALEEALDRA